MGLWKSHRQRKASRYAKRQLRLQREYVAEVNRNRSIKYNEPPRLIVTYGTLPPPRPDQ